MEQQVISGIVRASGVQAGETVLVHFWGDDEDLPIARGFMQAVMEQGASPWLLQQSRRVNQQLFASAKDGCFDEGYFRLLENVDAVLDVFAYRPIVLGAQLEDGPQQLYRRYMASLFRRLMKVGRFAQIRIPTAANAEESGLPPEEYVRRMNEAYAVDYGQLARACEAAVGKYPPGRYRIHTGEDCMLEINLTGRAWHVDAGDGDWPCGEVYIAPVEEDTRGRVYYPVLYIEDLGRFEGVTLEFEGGQVTGCNHAAVQAWLDTLPAEGRVVAELGLGMNPGVGTLCGYTVLDEKKAGTFHLALGANTMFGGKNAAAMHVDLVNDGEWSIKEEKRHG